MCLRKTGLRIAGWSLCFGLLVHWRELGQTQLFLGTLREMVEDWELGSLFVQLLGCRDSTPLWLNVLPWWFIVTMMCSSNLGSTSNLLNIVTKHAAVGSNCHSHQCWTPQTAQASLPHTPTPGGATSIRSAWPMISSRKSARSGGKSFWA